VLTINFEGFGAVVKRHFHKVHKISA